MRVMRKMTFWAMTILCLVSMQISAKEVFCDEMKVGYVNFEKIFGAYEKTKDHNEELQKKKYKKEVDGQKLVDEINKLRNELQLLSDEAKEEKQKALTDKMRKLRDFTNDSKEELLKERDIIFKKLTEEIVKVINETGEKDGYTLIFDDQVLLYKAKANELTADIIKILNDKYRKEKENSTAK